ncbi:MAG TPA: hypothetical protein VLX68_04800 [Chitinivibrionales bacterium]|nr:hypothetical protein [Chitinivibrionales bacterium]
MKIISCLLLFTVASSLSAFTLPDSLQVQAWAGAWISLQQPAGLKAYEAGIVDASVAHNFTDALFSRVAVRGTVSFSSPFFEEVSLGYRYKGLTARAGMLSEHVGRASLYKPFSVFNPFVRTSVIWDSYGFGLALDQRLGGSSLSGAAAINDRENGSAYLMWTALDNGVINERVIAGIQTQELQTQDNSATAGDDFCLNLPAFSLHAAAKYSYYQGWGNITMKQGYLTEMLGEAKYTPLAGLTLSGCGYYKEFNKSYYSNQILAGLDAQYLLFGWIGAYGGYEYQKSMDTRTQVPELGLAVSPFADRTLIRIGWESPITGNAWLNRIIGLLWLAF